MPGIDPDRITEFGIRAVGVNPEFFSGYRLPEPVRDEIPTYNQYGYMKLELDEFSQEFINYASFLDIPVLEIGCAYGYVVREILKLKKDIIASDISEEHLAVLVRLTDTDRLENLYLYPAAFPGDIDLPDKSLGAVLASRIMHFLTGEQIEKGLAKINRWLRPKGKLFFTALSPMNFTLRETFLPVYNERVRNGERWPGRIDSMRMHASDHASYIRDFFQAFDIPQLETLLPEFGFRVNRIKLFDYGNNDSDGKGHVGFMATKL